MPTTAGVYRLRILPVALGTPTHITTGHFNAALRFVSGLYSGGGGIDGTKLRKSLLPRQDVKFLDASGNVTDPWYRFFQFQYEKKLGGDNAPTVPQVTSTLAANQTATAAVAGSITNIVQAVEQNAAVTSNVIEVLVATAATAAAAPTPAPAPGPAPAPSPDPDATYIAATQIPPPVLTVPVYTPPRPTTHQQVE